MSEILAAFPDPTVAFLTKVGRKTLYRTPDGDFNRVTSILEALPKPFLVPWAAKVERIACIEAAKAAYAEGVEGGVDDFGAAIEARLGAAKEHQKIMENAADIGTAAHEEIQRQTRKMLGLTAAEEPQIRDESLVAVMAWQDWLKGSGLRPFKCEQTVWDAPTEVAGTIDALMFNSDGDLILIDYKTSKGIYDSHHVQVMKYLQMARNYADVKTALIVRIPKNIDDPQMEVKNLGHLYDRVLTEEQLIDCFNAARMLWRSLLTKGAL